MSEHEFIADDNMSGHEIFIVGYTLVWDHDLFILNDLIV